MMKSPTTSFVSFSGGASGIFFGAGTGSTLGTGFFSLTTGTSAVFILGSGLTLSTIGSLVFFGLAGSEVFFSAGLGSDF